MKRRVVVVGAGLGGLGVAVRLLASGFDVTVVERAPAVGGRAGQLRERGFTFDLGPSLVTMPELLDELFELAGTSTAAQVRLRRLSPFYRIRWHGETRDMLFSGDEERMIDQIAHFSADDARHYRAFCAAARCIYQDAILGAGRRPFLHLATFLALVPRMARLGALSSVDRFVHRFFQDSHIRQAFSFHPLFVGGDPFRVPAVYAALAYLQIAGGVWYTDGGVWAIVEALERLVRRGGTILTGTEVMEVRRRAGRVQGVRLASGESLEADVVVSNADAQLTRRLAGLPPVPRSLSMSCFLLHLGTTRAFPSLHHHTLLVGPGYRRFIGDVTKRRRMPQGISLYLHAPSRTDPAMAPLGGESLSALMPVPNLGGDVRWPDGGEELRERILDTLESDQGLALSGLRGSIAVERQWTPLDFRDRLGAPLGNAFGPEPVLCQSAYFRQHNRYRRPRGLYQVGAGTHPGAGIPGVLLTAEVTARLVAEDLGG